MVPYNLVDGWKLVSTHVLVLLASYRSVARQNLGAKINLVAYIISQRLLHCYSYLQGAECVHSARLT